MVLGRSLPLMIGQKVSEVDKNWLNFLLLLNIMDYLLTPVVSCDITSYLRVLIEDHHSEFARLYPSSYITPKFHFMVHYSEWIDT